MKLTFFGGVGEVTGSNYLLESEPLDPKDRPTRILIDCGLEQAGHYCEDSNFEPFPFDLKEIDAVIITHSHIDHIGRVPKLVRDGFKGSIISTPPAKDFAEELLLDSEHILGNEAEAKGREPLYTAVDVEDALGLWKTIRYHEIKKIKDFEIELYDAGHILGSSFVVVSTTESKKDKDGRPVDGAVKKKIVFSGDLGNVPAPLVKDTEIVNQADYVLVESTYGDRLHQDLATRQDLLENAIEDTVNSKGALMIPAFAMERTQELLYEINSLVSEGRIPQAPVFIDSPLAIRLTAIYKKYSNNPEYFDAESLAKLRGGDAIFDFPGLQTTLTTEESKMINDVPMPKVIIAGSGMSQGGRIMHHELRYLPDKNSTMLFIGFQVQGSLGRAIYDGEKKVRILGEEVAVRCRVRSIDGYSAHADQEGLIKWLYPMKDSLKKIFVTHGEPEISAEFAAAASDKLAVETEVPQKGESVIL
ncbi:MAG: MBL fold metallo-hydrolase [Patescibacteria group bacterium]|nr:MBL fold metallo-hydrolase [Patescibacteria group bacterium]